MKKRITCAMVMTAVSAGTASAAVTLVENENFTYELGVDLQIQLLQDSGVDEDLDVNYDDGELKNRFEYKLGNDLVGFGQLDFEVAKGEDVSREEAYIGLEKNGFSFFIGSSDYVTDDFGVEQNIDVVDVAGDAFLLDGSDELLSFAYSTDLYSIGLSHDLEVDDDVGSTDLMLFTEVQGFGLAVALQSATNIGIDDSSGVEILSDADTVGLSVGYNLGMFGIGLAYSSVDIDAAPERIDNFHIVGTLEPWSTTEFNLGFDIVDVGEQNSEVLGVADTDSWYLNVIYKFPEATGFRTFAEIGQTDIDGVDDIDAGFLVGMRLVF